MRNIHDLERIQQGPIFEELTVENMRNAFDRIVHLEQILATNTTQWNAPTLLRGGVNNVASAVATPGNTKNLFIQSGIDLVDHLDAWNGTYTTSIVTFSTAFDETPVVVATIKETTFNSTPTNVLAQGTTPTTFVVTVKTPADPTSGTCHVAWLAIGKKVE